MPDQTNKKDTSKLTGDDAKESQKNAQKEKETDKATAGEVTKTADKIIRFFNTDIDKNFIKKKGFLLALEGNGESKITFKEELEKLDDQYERLFKEFSISFGQIIENLKETDKRNKSNLEQLILKKLEYEEKIKNDIKSKEEVEKQLAIVQQEVYKLLTEIGNAKENIVESSLKSFGANMQTGLKISKDIQDQQNKELETEYQKYKSSDETKTKFWNNILQNYQEHYDKVTARIRILSKDGINQQTSAFLIFLGTVAALVSGWWFSIWTGGATVTASAVTNDSDTLALRMTNPLLLNPAIAAQHSTGVPANSSVRFFFLDNLSRFLASHTLIELVYGLTFYLLAVGGVSWLCYYLLVRFGFTQKPRQKNTSKSSSDADDSDDFEVRLQENDDILKTTFKGNSWWALWLKMAPVICALIPVLYILSYQSKKDGSNGFQNLFDGLANQFIGTCIAISFSTFTILYFSRITENKYHNKEENKVKGQGLIFYLGFIIFGLMIASMLMYHFSAFFFDDIRKVAIMGFVVSCIATGFSMGYGYLFRNLSISAEFLLERINILSDIIYRYSKPFSVNYTSNGLVRQRIYQLQNQVMTMISNRQELSTAIASGYDLQYKMKEPEQKPVVTPRAEGADKTEKKGQAKPEKINGNVLDQVMSFFKLKWLLQREQAEKQETKHNIVHNISNVEMKYFAEKTEQLGELNQRIKELKCKIEKIEQNEEEYFRNEGIFRSLKDQIKNMEEANRTIVEEIAKIETEIIFESDKLRETREKSKVFLKEGFQTGVWFKTMNAGSENNMFIN